MSRLARVKASAVSPPRSRQATMSWPSIPPAPVTSHRLIAPPDRGLVPRCSRGHPVARGAHARSGPLHGFPPATVPLVPADGIGQALAELYARGEAHAPEQRVVQGIAPVVPFAVLDMRHHLPVGPAAFEQRPGQLDIGQFRVPVDVIHAPWLSALEHQLDPTAVVIDMDPAADILSVPIQRDLEPVEKV